MDEEPRYPCCKAARTVGLSVPRRWRGPEDAGKPLGSFCQWDNPGCNVVYDNQRGAGDTADPSTVLGGGNIAIQGTK
jgi:hypothetical protein